MMRTYTRKKDSQENHTIKPQINQGIISSPSFNIEKKRSKSSLAEAQLKQSSSGFNFANVSLYPPANVFPSLQRKVTLGEIKDRTSQYTEHKKPGLIQSRMIENAQQQDHLQSRQNNISRKSNILQRTYPREEHQSINLKPIGTIQRSNIIQREISSLTLDRQKTGKSKKIDSVNNLVRQYNELDKKYRKFSSKNELTENNSSQHVSQLQLSILKLRQIINKVNEWTGSLEGKTENINESLSQTGIKGFFTRTKHLTSKLAKKQAKSESLGNWLGNVVQSEMDRVNVLFSNAYDQQMATDDKDNMFLGSSSPFIGDDTKLTKAQATAIRTYTSSFHFFMNDVMQLPERIAKMRMKSRLKSYMSSYALQERKSQLTVALSNLEMQSLMGKKQMSENQTTALVAAIQRQIEQLETQIDNYDSQIPKEITGTRLDILEYFEQDLDVLAKAKTSGFQSNFNRFITRATSDRIINRLYNEISVQNTMAIEGLHSLPGYRGKVYRGDWEGSIPFTYTGSKIKFSFFGSTSKDKKIAMDFTSYYRSRTQDTKDQDQGK